MSFFKTCSLFNILYKNYRTNSGNKSFNSGIQKRIKLFTDENPEVETLKLDEQELEQYEDEFSGASSLYNQHLRESRKVKSMMEFKRIERKYFKSLKLPNLLTWSEKEQIRYLSNSDPSTWTPEKLSLSFPATTHVIKKILKSQWKPLNDEDIKRHDRSVSNNWKAIEKGDIKLSPSVQAHIQNFTSRKNTKVKFNQGNEISLREESISQLSSTEFVDIIRSYKNKEPENSTASTKTSEIDLQMPNHPSETYVLNEEDRHSSKKKHYTLEELKKEYKLTHVKNEENTKLDEHFITGIDEPKNSSVVQTEANLKFKSSEVSSKIETMTDSKFGSKHQNYRLNDDIELKITIPKEKKQSGSVYKVKDCYYNDEGEFLYKVPGMS